MERIRHRITLASCVLLAGCHGAATKRQTPVIASLEATRIEQPVVCPTSYEVERAPSLEPNSTRRGQPTEFWELTLAEAVSIAVSNSQVLRDLGGQVVYAPESIPSQHQVAITHTDPRFGVEAALSAFDSQFTARAFGQNNDRVFNNNIAGLGVNEFQQDIFGLETGIRKRTATGTQFSINSLTNHDANNSTTNLFPSAWDTQVSASVRHPLLRGGGVDFNRIAGPDAQPGYFLAQGVLLARVSTDISVADFEAGVTRFINDVETAYWELYFAYRNLDSVAAAKERSQRIVEQLTELTQAQQVVGYRQLAAEIQLHALDDQHQIALNGNARGGLSVGVYRGERQLRWLLGLPATDGRLIRPADEPSEAELTFNWEDIRQEALTRRVELRRQDWEIKRRELELIAAKNFVLPQLDLYSTYRVRGFGDDFAGTSGGRFSNSLKDLGSFDHQEWEGGLEFSMPAGYRQGWAAVRNAQIKLARERAIRNEQEKRIVVELSDAVAEADRAMESRRAAYRRLMTALAYAESIESAVEDRSDIPPESRLDAVNQVAEAEVQYHRAMVDYSLAMKELHRTKGSLLQLNGIALSEGDWPQAAYRDAKYNALQWVPRSPAHAHVEPGILSRGDSQVEYDLPIMSEAQVEPVSAVPADDKEY